MRSTPSRVRSAISLGCAAVLALGACASTGSEGEPTATPTASASATTGLPAPIIVEPDETAVEAKVGETIVFDQDDPAHSTVRTDNADVLELTQGYDDGSALFNPAAKALAPGVAVVTIEAADGTVSEVTVTVR